MSFFLLTGRNPGGVVGAEWVEADSGDAAAAALRRQGYSEVVLQTDDIEALGYQRGSPAVQMPAALFLQFRSGGLTRPALWRVILATYYECWKFLLGALVALLIRRWLSPTWSTLDFVLLGLFTIPFLLSLASRWLPLPSQPFDDLMDAIAWGRWRQALDLIPAVRPLINNDVECGFREAQALAGLGQLEAALETVRPFADGTRMPLFLYNSRLTDLYNAAAQRSESLRCIEVAASLAPELPTVLLDYAALIMRVRPDPPRVRELLNQVRAHELTPFLKITLTALEGVLALHEGRPRDAVPLLKRFLAEHQQCGMKSPLIYIFTDIARGYLALALARTGDAREAFQLFSEAEPRLTALKSDYLLVPCREALRLPQE